MSKILARSVEVNLTSHCNLRCYGCDHASPVRAEGYLSVEDLSSDLKALAGVYQVFEFFLTGGEPLLHPRLLEIIDTIRDSGIPEKISMATNGVLLHQAPEELWGKIDKLWVSLYPGVKRTLSNDEIRDLGRRHGVVVYLKETDDFTNKLLHVRNQDRELVKAIYSTCTLRASCHTLHEGRYYKCSPSPFVLEWLRLTGGEDLPDFSGDSVAVRGNEHLADDLAGYLADEEPLVACSYCLGCAGKTIPSRQMNRAAGRQWLDERESDLEAMIDWDALAKARQELEGSDLSGRLSSMVGQRARWWGRRLKGGSGPT